MSKNVEQRKYSRSHISLCVQVRLETGVLIEGHAKNLSLNGLFFETERSLPLGSRVKVLLTVDNAPDQTEISCLGVVSRIDEGGVAIEISRTDEESMLKLADLLREATANKDSLDKELEVRLKTLLSDTRP